jgi:hypothetical protein
MASNTSYNPTNINNFEKEKLNKDAKGVAATIPAGTSASLDLTLTNDSLIAGGTVFLAKGANPGDKVDFQIVHPLAGVISQFISDWYVNPDSTLQAVPTANYPAKIPAGLIMRIVYHSTGTSDVWIVVNYNLEKVLE